MSDVGQRTSSCFKPGRAKLRLIRLCQRASTPVAAQPELRPPEARDLKRQDESSNGWSEIITERSPWIF